MTAKKKDLATELIDDLLGEVESRAGASPQTATVASAASGQPAPPNDETLKLGASQILSHPGVPAPQAVVPSGSGSAHTGTGLRSVGTRSGAWSLANEAHLHQIENLRVAQQKILDLEAEMERLRHDNHELVTAGEILRKENESLVARDESLIQELNGIKESMNHEKQILEEANSEKDRDLRDLRSKVAEFETRMAAGLHKVRVRERELENRLELQKIETSALVRNKDEMLLDLKRQIDVLNVELANYRGKTQELSRKLQDKQELLRKTVKALRIALSLLEGEEEKAG
jgi:hypothetical protein